MKKILIIALAMMLPVCMMAQKKGYKLVESNPSSKPKWVTEKENMDFIYIKGQEGATLADAKGAAMKGVVDEISQSVAVKVEGEIIDNSVMNVNNDQSEYHEEYINRTKTKLAKMPAIQGIAIQNADVYYERYYNKKSGDEYYMVYLRYPFSQFDRKAVIDAYNEQERVINEKIQTYLASTETVTSIEEINTNISFLNGLKKELDEEDSRVHQINTIIGLYYDIFKSTIVEIVENRPGHFAVRLIHKGRLMTTSQKPTIKSSCASAFDVRYIDGICHVDFDSQDCYPQDDPEISITFKAGNSKASKQLRIKFK